MKHAVLTITVPEECDNMRANTYLRRYCNISARTITKLKREENGILRNGALLKTIDTVRAGDSITLNLPQDENTVEPVPGALDILYEDEYLLAVNKPGNMPVHPTKVYQLNTLANHIVHYARTKSELYQIRIVNRLDKNTSGIVVIAKNRHLAFVLPQLLKKKYTAVCQGNILRAGTVNSPIGIKPGHTVQRETSPNGVRAVTHYVPVACMENHTLLDIELETGRTHQIRCHLSSIGHPLAGDDMYGGSTACIARQALHCREVVFCHPVSGEIICLQAPMPEDMNILLKQL